MNFLTRLLNVMCNQWHHVCTNQDGDVEQMFTPPKSKSPWEAGTSGSTGGWAGFAGPSTPTNPDDPAGWGWVGPALTTALGAVPGWGPALSAGMGAIGAGGMGGFQGTDSGWGKGIMDTLGGGVAGYGLGALGSGIGGAAKGAMSGGMGGLGSGFQSGMSNYLGTNIIPGMQGTSGSGIWGSLTGGGTTGGSGGTFGPAAGGYASTGFTSGAGAAGGGITMEQLMNPMTLMGGATALGSQFLGTTPPVPQLGEITSKWLTGDSVTKAGQLAQNIQNDEYLGDFKISKQTQALMEVQEKDIKKAYKERRSTLDKMGLGQNDQFMNSGERLEMMEKMNKEEEDEIQKMRTEWLNRDKQVYDTNKYNSVMSALKIDDQTKQDLLFAEAWEVQQNYNIDMQTLMDFRNLAKDAGMYMIQQGMK